MRDRKTILVTGGAGFLGSHLCDRLIADGHDVICVDNRSVIETGEWIRLQSELACRSSSHRPLPRQAAWPRWRTKERGKKAADRRGLTADQEARIRKLICDKRPEQLKMDFALWNRGAVSDLIERECGLKLTMRAVGNYLKRWGMTPQKPIKRAYEQRPEAVKQWLDEEYPAIEARAKAEGGEIQWGDETAVVNTDVRGRCYAPRGETPVAYAAGTRQKLSMISTVTNKGKARWMIIDDNFNADKLIEFLTALIKGRRKKYS